MAMTVAPITDADVARVGQFLHEHLNKHVPADHWARAVDTPWECDRPNAGFMLLDGDELVGAHLAFYSERTIEGRRERFCNLGAWCVLPKYRFHGLRLLKALLAQDGYTFTDLTPSGNVPDINLRLGFQELDNTTALVPNLPWPSFRGRISSDPAVIERTLTGDQLALYRDHAKAAAARHAVLTRNGDSCYVIFRKHTRKNLPLFASILYVSNPELFRAMARPFARHLLLRHGVLLTSAEERIVKHRPRPAFTARSVRRRMFRSPHLQPDQIDYLYSELVCTSW
jgi:hypothetical protein